MSNLINTSFQEEDGVRGVSESEQGLLTSAGAVTVKRLTILGRITTGGKYGFYAPGNSDGTEVPVAVSLSEVVATGAGDDTLGVMLAGKVREDRLIIHGSAAGVGITDAIKDLLRTQMIIVEPAIETAGLDNA